MNQVHPLTQTPAPGTRHLRFRGDCQRFTLRLTAPQPGGAWLRTNLGRAAICRREVTRQVDQHETRLARDWFDIPMRRISDKQFEVILPLVEVGHFEAKAFFLESGQSDPAWPPGDNITINVEPADTCCANIIYNAFVRQFGPNKTGRGFDLLNTVPIDTLDAQGYTLIPPSGTFRDLIKHLDFIIGHLGCRILQLLPIFPTPTTYARMGRFGSPFAALSFTEVDSALAEFDPRATPLEQFVELIDAVHSRGAKLIIDIAINHTGWAARLHETHPQWLVRDSDGRIEMPGAWGVRWEDLTRLDYTHQGLWRYMAEVFLTWCQRGVDGFRCDAGYMIPEPAWEYMVTRVRQQFPDTLFLLEGLGGKISVTRRLLDTANLNWAYSELFQNYDRRQISVYLPQALEIAASQGVMVHFAETHDNNRLAARSRTWARLRTALCALASQNGAFGFANGVEWYATEKIDVHDAPSLNWGSPDNQVDTIRQINQLLKTHPAFFDHCKISLIGEGDGNSLALLRHHPPSGKRLLVVANLDDRQDNPCTWSAKHSDPWQPPFLDLLSGRKVHPERRGNLLHLNLAPGQVYCLAGDSRDLEIVHAHGSSTAGQPARTTAQLLRAKALDVFCAFNGTRHIGDMHPDRAARLLTEDPLAFCSQMNPQSAEPCVMQWNFPADARRQVMVPPGYFLLVATPFSFRARIVSDDHTLACEASLPRSDGTFFALFSPLPEPRKPRTLYLSLSVYTQPASQHLQAPLLYLPPAERAVIHTTYSRGELMARPHLFLSTNGRGAMLRAPVPWGHLYSRYDALLAANLNSDYPDDRHIMFTCCRAWLRFQGFSTQIDRRCLLSFSFDSQTGGYWRFSLPTGQGQHVHLAIRLRMLPDKNETQLTFRRLSGRQRSDRLNADIPVTLILRPDIEDRNFHDLTKAYTGPEHTWPAAITAYPDRFTFRPADSRQLSVTVSSGNFIQEPEWRYMVHRPLDAQRGQDPDSDLFSPGYFEIQLRGDIPERLTACIHKHGRRPEPLQRVAVQSIPAKASGGHRQPASWLADILDTYVVARGNAKSVIAGYPWFLDWGRDALIFTRGLITAGRHDVARKILIQFGRFEKNGTLPNMIQGETAANRDTSDAPLWFVLACAELVRSEKRRAFLQADCGGRRIEQVVRSIINSYLNGTPNGIQVDTESGLVFSPVHFTWMDTNHPAGTPRQGYPIEIQALWYAALCFMKNISVDSERQRWTHMAERVRRSTGDLFYLQDAGYLSDCLHATPHATALNATADDSLRPNQLLAVTLGAIKSVSMQRSIVNACQCLLVPGAIRSLADQGVAQALEIWHNERLLIDPHHPYQGIYAGDEDTARKPAYHNGTAWTWPFPSFCEAWVAAYGKTATKSARALLSSSLQLVRDGCVGHIPEILDGDYPHVQRGCDAQAWGLSEFVRVWLTLAEDNNT